MSALKPISLKPFTGLLDVRSPPDLMPAGSWRRRLNWMTVETHKLGRRDGWRRFLYSASGYHNADWHDQLLALVPGATREPCTLLKELVTTWGTRYLLAGSASRLYQLNETTGNWKMLGHSFGAGHPDPGSLRWQAAQVLNTVVLTNNWDAPVSYTIDAEPDADGQTVSALADLDLIGLSKAGAVGVFKDIVIFGNVILEGGRQENLLVWSDRLAPASFDPSKAGTLADSQALAYGERIERIEEFGDYVLVYTNQRIWRGAATGDPDQSTLAFVTVYESPEKARGYRCLAYPYTLVSTGAEHYYLGRDGIYRVTGFTAPSNPPERVGWAHLASDLIFRSGELDATNCHAHVGVYWSARQEVQFFWAVPGASTPGHGLALDFGDRTAHELDYGLTAGCEFRSDSRISYRDWIRQSCGCDVAALPAGFALEGLPASDVACDSTPAVWLTSATETLDGLATERWDTLSPEAGAWADGEEVLGKRADHFCAGCNEAAVLVVAAGSDYALKQCGGVYQFERCSNAGSGSGTLDGNGRYQSFAGTYESDGYLSVLTSGPLALGEPGLEKAIRRFILDAEPAVQATPSAVSLRIGTSYSPLDPLNSAAGEIIWTHPRAVLLASAQKRTAAEYQAKGTRPGSGLNWPLFAKGRYLYLELSIGSLQEANDLRSNLLPGTGGACNVSGALLHVVK